MWKVEPNVNLFSQQTTEDMQQQQQTTTWDKAIPMCLSCYKAGDTQKNQLNESIYSEGKINIYAQGRNGGARGGTAS